MRSICYNQSVKNTLICILSVIMSLISGFSVLAEVSEWWVEEGSNPYEETADSPILRSFPGGLTVDWQRKAAISRGWAALNGSLTVQNRAKIRRNAENMALERLISSVGLIRVDGVTRLSDIIDNDFPLRSSIISLIKKTARVIHEKVYGEGDILEVTLEFNLAGKAGLAGTFFPEYLMTLPSPSGTNEAAPDGAITGLIIDASNLGVEGGISPNVVSEDGRKIYCLKRNIDKRMLILEGFVDYSPSIGYSSAEVSRAGDFPLTVAAKSKLKSPYNCDIVLSREDADRILEADSASNFLRDLKVVILL